VQYNALIDFASDGKNGYSGSWSGPSYPYAFANETSALDVLLGGLLVANGTTGNSTSPSQTGSPSSSPSPSQGSQTHSPTGAIVGGVVGGLVTLLFAIGAIILYRRVKRRQKRLISEIIPSTDEDYDPYLYINSGQQPMPVPEPFVMENGRSRGESNSASALDEKALGESALVYATSNTITDPPSSSTNQPQPSANELTSSSSSSDPQPQAEPQLSTTELVGMLNERLRRGDVIWNPEESPPVYGPTERSEP